MKIEYKEKAADPINNLDLVQQRCYKVANVVGFISIFVWVLKILFF